jgi:AcrR family transcriptional regulator
VLASEASDVQKRGRASRAAILGAAKTLFAQNGYRGTSLASIAEAAGFSQPGLLHHFPSKEALLLGVLSEQDQGEERIWSPDHPVTHTLDMLEGLSALTEYNQSHPLDSRFLSVLLAEGISADHPAHDYFVHRYENLRRSIEEDIRRGQEADAVDRHVDPAAVAAIIVASLDGLQYQWLLDPEIDRSSIFKTLATLLRAALVTSPSDR